jgi:hypothetical protein
VTAVAGGLITLEQGLAGLGYQGTPGSPLSARDQQVYNAIAAATAVVEKITRTPILSKSVTIRANGGKSGVALPYSLASAAAVTLIKEDGVTTTDYLVDDQSCIVYAGTSGSPRTFAAGRQNIEITFTTGFNPVPSVIQEAVVDLVAFWIQMKQAPSPQFDDTSDSDMVNTQAGFAVPNSVREKLAPYTLTGGLS